MSTKLKAPPSREKSLRLVGQQAKYLSHLKKQIVQLRNHDGAFGTVGYHVEDRAEIAKEIDEKLAAAEGILSGDKLDDVNSTLFPDVATSTLDDGSSIAITPITTSSSDSLSTVPEPDLELLANNLESLARRLIELEGLADAQGAGLRQDLARVMEVFEDPAAFLPTPLKQVPPMPDLYKQHEVEETPVQPRQQSSRRHGKHARFGSPPVNGASPNPIHSTPLHESTNQYVRGGVISSPSLISNEIDGLTSSLSVMPPPQSFDPSTPVDPLDSFRFDVARQINSWRSSSVLDDARDEVRRLAREASSGGAGVNALNKLHALTGTRVETRRTGRGGGAGGKKIEIDESLNKTVPPPKARPPPKSMANPDLYPWTAQLQEIFRGVRLDGTSPANGAVPPPPNAFGGLAQTIPAYLEYQSYLQGQLLAQEHERQLKEAQRLAEEKRERDEAQRLAEDIARRTRAAQAAAAAVAAEATISVVHQPVPIAQPPPPPIIPPIAVPPPTQYISAGIQTSARPDYYPAHGDQFHPTVQQASGPVLPRFDAVWEVVPSTRDESVQWTGPGSSAQSALPSPRIHPSMAPNMSQPASRPMSPRRPTSDATRASHANAPPLSPRASLGNHTSSHVVNHAPEVPHAQTSETIARMGHGPTLVQQQHQQGSRSNPLTVLEQAALELQLNSKIRGEGPNSSKALESLLEMASQPHHGQIEANSSEPLDVPPHPLFGGTPGQQLANYPNSQLLSLVLQMYDMPSDAQVDAEWKRVLDAEEERIERERLEKEAAENKPSEVLAQPLPQVEEEEDEYKDEFNTSTVAETTMPPPVQPTEIHPPHSTLEADSRLADEVAAIARAKEEAEQRRLAAEQQAATLAAELQRVKDEAAQAIERAKAEATATAAAAAAAAAAIAAAQAQPVVQAPPAPSGGLTNEQRAEMQRLAIEAAAELRRQEIAAGEAVRAKEASSSQATSAKSVDPTPPPQPTPTESQLLASVASEVERIRALQASEQSLLSKARQDDELRFQAELDRREAERARLIAAHEAEEARFEQRRAEREAEELRRRQLEKRRDELLNKKMELEAERTASEMAKLRADLEALRRKQEEAPPMVTPTLIERTPLSRYKPRAVPESDTEDSWSSSNDNILSTPSLGNTGTHDLSEGEIDMRGAGGVSPGLLIPPPTSSLRLPHSSRPKLKPRHSAVAPHPPVTSDTPVRPVQAASSAATKPATSATATAPSSSSTTREQKYPADDNDLLNSSTTRDEIFDLLRQSASLRDSLDSIQSDVSDDPTRGASGVAPLRTELNLPYSASISGIRRALAAPSRQVLVGSQSPPLVDDLTRLVRESIDNYDLGTSSDNIGGLFGMDRPQSSRSVLSEPRELDDSIIDYSFNSPGDKPNATEQWLKSLKDEP